MAALRAPTDESRIAIIQAGQAWEDATRAQNAAAFGGDAGAVPLQAITLGLAEILAAERILLVVTGAAKATILRRALLDPACPEVPASWLQHHPRLEVLVDGAAAAALPRVR